MHPKIDEAILEWFNLMRGHGMPIGGQIIKTQALRAAKKLNHSFFQAMAWKMEIKERCSVQKA